jgi:hypothetical protein
MNTTLSKSICDNPLMEISLGSHLSDLRLVEEGYHRKILDKYRIKRWNPRVAKQADGIPFISAGTGSTILRARRSVSSLLTL